MGTRRRIRLAAWIVLAAVVVYHLALLFVQVRHPEPFLNDSVLQFGLIRAMASAPARGQSILDPWVATWTLGFPAFHYYQNLPHLFVLGLWKACLGGLTLLQAFRVVEWLAVGTLPIPVYLALRKLGFSRAAGVAAGALTLWVKTDYLHGLDFESYVWQGLGQYTQAFGGWFLPLGIAWTCAALRDGRGYAAATALMTATFLSHFALGYMAFMAVGLYVLVSPREIPRRLARLALIVAVSAAASAYVVLPILTDFAYYNVSALVPTWKYDSFGHVVVLQRLVRGEIFDFGRPPVLTILVAFGVLGATIRARREADRFLLVLLVFFVLLYFGRPTWRGLLDYLPLSSGFHYSRAVYLVHVVGTMLAGIAVGDLLARLARGGRARTVAAVAIGAVVAAPLAWERTGYLRHNASLVREAAAAYAAERSDLEGALALAREDRQGRVYAGQGAAGSRTHWGGGFMVGYTPVYAWFPIREMDALGYLHHMWSLNADLQSSFDERNPIHYRVFNVRRIIAPPDVRTISAARELRRFGRFRVLQVDGPGFLELVDVPYWMNVPKRNLSRVQRSWLRSHLPGEGIHPAIRLLEEGAKIEGAVLADGVDVRFPEPAAEAGARGEVVDVTRQGDDFRASVVAERPCHLLLKMSFHPGWRATVDGTPVETVQLMPSYVGVPVEAGAHEVELRWEPGSRKATLAGAGLAILIVFGVMERRFRR